MDDEKIKRKYEAAEIYLEFFLDMPSKVQQLLLTPLLWKGNVPTAFYTKIIKSPIEQIFITAFELYCRDKKQIILLPQKEVSIEREKILYRF